MPAPIGDLGAWPREGSLFLRWSVPTKNTDNTNLEDLVGFRVWRAARPLSAPPCNNCPMNFEPMAEIDVEFPRGARVENGMVWWEDTSLRPQYEYVYRVISYNVDKYPSPDSNQVRVFWDSPPAAPGDVTVGKGDLSLEINWEFSNRLLNGKEMTEAPGFNIYRRLEGQNFGFFPLNPEPLRDRHYWDGVLQAGRDYLYEVRTVRNFRGTPIEGPSSPEVKGVPEKLKAPSPPTGLIAAPQSDGMALRWRQNPEPDVAGYNLYRREEGQNTWKKVNSTLIPELYFLDPSAELKKTYSYRLSAVDKSPSARESAFSQEAEVTFVPPPKPAGEPASK